MQITEDFIMETSFLKEDSLNEIFKDVLYLLNSLPNRKITGKNYTTYDLAKRVEKIDLNNLYILIEWPESQMIMNKEWINECVLGDNCSYFVPIHRV